MWSGCWRADSEEGDRKICRKQTQELIKAKLSGPFFLKETGSRHLCNPQWHPFYSKSQQGCCNVTPQLTRKLRVCATFFKKARQPMIEWRTIAMPFLRKELSSLCDFQGTAFSSLLDAPAGVCSPLQANAFTTFPASFSIKVPHEWTICYQLQKCWWGKSMCEHFQGKCLRKCFLNS